MNAGQPWFRESFSWVAVPYHQSIAVQSKSFSLPCNNADVKIRLSVHRFQAATVTVLHVQAEKFCKIPYAAADITIKLSDGSCQTEKIRDWSRKSGVFCFSNETSCDQWRPDINCDIDWYGFVNTEEVKNSLNKKKYIQSKELFLSSVGSDISFLIGDKILPAHRSILAYYSPCFCAQLKKNNDSDKKTAFLVKDADYETMKELLSFLYTGKFQFDDVSTWALVEAAALSYRIEDLRLYCQSKIINFISSQIISDRIEDLYL